MSPLLIQTGASLVAILALAGLARWLGLGGDPRLASGADVARIAAEAVEGFVPVAEGRDGAGRAALARDGAGRILLIKRHGNRFAARLLGPGARASVTAGGEGGLLAVDCGEARFGTVTLALPEPEAWAEAINRLEAGHHG